MSAPPFGAIDRHALSLVDEALELATRRRYPRGPAWGPSGEADDHRAALRALAVCAGTLAAYASAERARPITAALARAVVLLAAPRTRGEIVALAEAEDVLEGVLREELAAMRRSAA